MPDRQRVWHIDNVLMCQTATDSNVLIGFFGVLFLSTWDKLRHSMIALEHKPVCRPMRPFLAYWLKRRGLESGASQVGLHGIRKTLISKYKMKSNHSSSTGFWSWYFSTLLETLINAPTRPSCQPWPYISNPAFLLVPCLVHTGLGIKPRASCLVSKHCIY